jgi:glycosyltransferase involved in cell wall biosynthesis
MPNGYDESDFVVPSSPPTETFTITYTGTLASEYPLEVLVDAIAGLNNAQTEPLIHLRFVGNVAPEKQRYIEKQLGSTVKFIPQVPHRESINYLMSSTALLLIIPEVKDNAGILTGKLFEYLAANKPIIAIGPPAGDAASIMNECTAGIMFDKNDSAGIASHLQQLIAQWKTNPNLDLPERAQVKSYSRKGLTGRLMEVI